MVLENIRALADSVIERIKNPFGGTLILVWTLFNWKFVFTIFNFEEAQTLAHKTYFIENYFSGNSNWNLIWGPILLAFIATISYLTLQNLSLIIYTFFSKWIRPGIFWLVDRNELSTKETVEELRVVATRAQSDYEATRHKLINITNENAELRKSSIDNQVNLERLKNEFEELKAGELIFIENFDENSKKRWSINYWGKEGDESVCRIVNNVMIIEAKPEDIPRKEKETGAYVDILGGIFKGKKYKVTAKVSASVGATMQFRLWLQDSVGGSSMEGVFKAPSTDGEIVSNEIVANETNAIRIHLHCKAGNGSLYIKDVRLTRA